MPIDATANVGLQRARKRTERYQNAPTAIRVTTDNLPNKPLHAPSEAHGTVASVKSLGISVLQTLKVERYISRHQDVTHLVLGLCKATTSHFDLTARLSLQVYEDPEASDQHLLLLVQPRTRGPEVRQAIEKISAKFEDELSETSGFVLVDLDYIH